MDWQGIAVRAARRAAATQSAFISAADRNFKFRLKATSAVRTVSMSPAALLVDPMAIWLVEAWIPEDRSMDQRGRRVEGVVWGEQRCGLRLVHEAINRPVMVTSAGLH